MRPYRVKISVRNNLLLSAIEAAGFGSVAAFAKAAEVEYSSLSALIGLRLTPINAHGEFTTYAKAVMEVLGACPSDLWTDEQLHMGLRKNTAEREVSTAEAVMLGVIERNTLPSPEEAYEAVEAKQMIDDAMDSVLNPRERHVLRARIHEDRTLRDVAEREGVSLERIRQIEQKALRKLRQRRMEEFRDLPCPVDVSDH